MIISKAMVAKLKAQNDKLRGQLKDLNSKLTDTLDKYKAKKAPQPIAKTEFRDETIRKELDNSSKQITSYQKEITALKSRLESFQGGEK